MGENSNIEWTDHTFNGWIGCTKVSPGCAHCYAENETFTRVERSKGRELWGKGKPRHRTSAAAWRKPITWNKTAICNQCGFAELLGSDDCRKCGLNFSESNRRRPRVFCASMSDWLDNEAPIEWLADLLSLIHDTPNLDWLLLTKRPENWKQRIGQAYTVARERSETALRDWLWYWETKGRPPGNVWIGISAEDQPRADERIPEVLKIPAKIRFLSVEPMLGPIEFSDVSQRSDALKVLGQPALSGIHWAIFGGESGPGARPCNFDWIREGVKQCRAANVKPFVKQLGTKACYSRPNGGFPLISKVPVLWVGVGMKEPKGGDMSEWPEDLRVREFPV